MLNSSEKMPSSEFQRGGIPKRLIVAVMIFIACATSFMLRVNMSINLLAMVQPKMNSTVMDSMTNITTPNANESFVSIVITANLTEPILPSNITSQTTKQPEVQNYGPRYKWDQGTQARILGAYFYGFMVTSLPAGLMAERYGPKLVVALSFVVSAIATAATPALAEVGPWYVIASRAIVGVVAGLVYPALQNLISRWIPPNERGKVIACISGGSTFGTVITWPISGILTEQFGWNYAFYFPSIFLLIIAVIWFLLIENSPDQHSSITAEEKKIIDDALGNTISKSKSWPPFGKVFTSLPFLALMLLHYGCIWGMSFFITQAPKFMNEVLGFKLANAGFLSSMPYLARMFSGFFFGYIGDVILQKEVMSRTAMRKTFCIFSHFLPGVLLAVLPFIAQDPLVCVGCIVLCLGFNGSATITNLVNAQDLAPNFAASLYGFLSFLGTTAGFIAPMLVAYCTAENSTINEWKYVFLITAVIYFVTGVAFVTFGSGQVQEWNSIKPKSEGITNDGMDCVECSEIKRH
ncbi:sialin-like isoform X2 [Sabethes cyaneus]|uniref:sialin-like isoform X2 n=1 Tax=Sabethes cyaneus TaxID=53552 RepID=UPI00237EE0A4|nr:sialin-like isoform X2 [Sabethes cyaneus]